MRGFQGSLIVFLWFLPYLKDIVAKVQNSLSFCHFVNPCCFLLVADAQCTPAEKSGNC